MKVFYIYFWLRNDGTPYYIGKGSGNRAFINESHKVNRPEDNSRILLQEFLSEEDAFFAEMFLVAYYGRKDIGTGILRNQTDGGDNPPKQYGKRSEAHCKVLSEALTGRVGGMTGKHHSPETRLKMSKPHGCQQHPRLHLSEEHKRKIRESNRRTWYAKNIDSSDLLREGCSER